MPSKHSARGRGSRATVCRDCGRSRDVAGSISARGLCEECREAIMSDTVRELVAGEGPHFDRWSAEWRTGMKAWANSL